MSQPGMYEGNDIEEEEIDDEEIGEYEMDEDMDYEDMDDEEFYEAMYISVMTIYALMHVLNRFLIMMRGEQVERPLTRNLPTSI
ncbi:unnamed protein product [Prunus armeniaca]